MDPTYPLVPVANFLACILVLASLSKNMFQSWNIGVCSFAVWVVVMAFATAVNSIIWANSVENLAPVWCDIVSRLGVGSTGALPAASFVIVRRLSIMMRQRDPVLDSKQKLNMILDLSLCVGSPIAMMGLYYIVQAARYQILEEFGCVNTVQNTGLSILLLNSFAIVFPLLSLVLYSPRLIWMYFKHRELDELLASSSHLDRRSFSKVLALGLFDILITLPIGIFGLVTNLVESGGIITFWPGWSDGHSEISTVPMVTSEEWHSTGLADVFIIKFDQWTNPLYAIVFFALFGLTEKNRLWYRKLFWKIAKPLGFTPRQHTLAASNIVFDSGPVPPDSTMSGFRATMTHRSAAPDTEDIFKESAKLEEARSDAYGTQTAFVYPSLPKVPLENA